jgi:hypothetical protein
MWCYISALHNCPAVPSTMQSPCLKVVSPRTICEFRFESTGYTTPTTPPTSGTHLANVTCRVTLVTIYVTHMTRSVTPLAFSNISPYRKSTMKKRAHPIRLPAYTHTRRYNHACAPARPRVHLRPYTQVRAREKRTGRGEKCPRRVSTKRTQLFLRHFR